jgi:penicillin-binding protein 2
MFWRVRLRLLALVGVVMLGMLILRLYHEQIQLYADNDHRAHLNTIYDKPLPAPRGKILDATGHVLVSNQPRYMLAVVPQKLPQALANLRNVAPLLGLDTHKVLARARKRALANQGEAYVLVQPLDDKQLARLAPMLPNLEGVQMVTTSTRRYPYGALASHVLGYVGEISEDRLNAHRDVYSPGDIVGQSGLEAEYDRQLRGKKGTTEVYMNAAGHAIKAVPGTDPTPGVHLQLTLDLPVQQQAEQSLQKTLNELYVKNGEKTGGAVVVMNARNGGVLAMASLPNYDPRKFARGIRAREYTALIKDKQYPLLNRVTQAAFPPGSTFKIINASACLQEKICTAASQFYCSGWYKGFHCFVQSGHGHLDFYNAIALSCDATFYMLGDRLGINKLHKYAAAFGLGRQTGVDLPAEMSGICPGVRWKQKYFHEPWFEGETIVMSIGQGYLIATPLQMAVACAAVANGGTLVTPHLVNKMISLDRHVVWRWKPGKRRRVPVAPRYLAAVRKGMAGAVDHGTATAAQSKIVSIAGKTGTAEAVATSENPHARNHVWFVSFAPIDHPKIVAVVMVEKAGGFGGSVAAPIAKDVIERYFTEHGGGDKIQIETRQLGKI